MSMDQVNTDADIDLMQAALSNVMGMLKHAVTEFEAELWLNIMRRTPRVKFENFLKTFLMSPQSRYGAPKPSDAAQALGFVTDPETAYAVLERAVSQFGPYQQPQLADPVLIQAVHNLGGWARVNEVMPSQENTFEVRAFKERFVAALNSASNQVRIEGMAVEPLLAIGAARPPVFSLENSARDMYDTPRVEG